MAAAERLPRVCDVKIDLDRGKSTGEQQGS